MTTLEQVYQEIARHLGEAPGDSRPSRATFELVDRLLHEHGPNGIADFVIDSSLPDTPWASLAEVLAILIWSTPDNGAEIMRHAEQWLREAADERRVFVALNLDVYPFASQEEMNGVLSKIAATFPDQAGLCRSAMESRGGR